MLPSGRFDHLDTPRRLAVLASGIPAAQPDRYRAGHWAVGERGLQRRSADSGRACVRQEGRRGCFANSKRITTPKGEYLAGEDHQERARRSEILAELLPKEIASIYWPKNMYWRKPSERFVRPVRWLVAMLDGEVIPLEFDGVRAGNQSRGHRILADRHSAIPRAGAAYVEALRAAKVLSRAEREQQIRKALDAATRTIPGARWREDKVAARYRRQSDRVAVGDSGRASIRNFWSCPKKCWSR